jgi:transposase
MPRAYSVDLRERSLRALASGMPAAEVAQLFDVSVASLYRWRTRLQTCGDLTAGRSSGRPRAIPPGAEAALRAQVAAAPDATLAEHCARWQVETGEVVSRAALHRALGRLGLTRKKRA